MTAAGLLGALGCDSRPPTTGGARAPIINGTKHGNPAVVALRVEFSDGSGARFCSGTFVGPNLIVTAAHCLLGPVVQVYACDDEPLDKCTTWQAPPNGWHLAGPIAGYGTPDFAVAEIAYGPPFTGHLCIHVQGTRTQTRRKPDQRRGSALMSRPGVSLSTP